MNADFLFGAAVAALALFLLGLIVLLLLYSRIAETAKLFVMEAYEPALYEALKDHAERGVWSMSCTRWRQHWNVLAGFRLHWIPSIRQRVKELHQRLGDKFQVDVMTSGIPTLENRPWTVVVLDQSGQEITSTTDAKTHSAALRAGQEGIADHWQSTGFLVKSPDGKVFGIYDMDGNLLSPGL